MIKAVSILLIPLLLISLKSYSSTTRSAEPTFSKKKSWPIYNSKYILKAQRNIKSGNCEEDTNHPESELTDTAAANREMYRKVLLQQNDYQQSVKSSLTGQSTRQTSTSNKRRSCNLSSEVTNVTPANTTNVNQEYDHVKETTDSNDIDMQVLRSLQSEINKLKQELNEAKEQLAQKNSEPVGYKHLGEVKK